MRIALRVIADGRNTAMAGRLTRSWT